MLTGTDAKKHSMKRKTDTVWPIESAASRSQSNTGIRESFRNMLLCQGQASDAHTCTAGAFFPKKAPDLRKTLKTFKDLLSDSGRWQQTQAQEGRSKAPKLKREAAGRGSASRAGTKSLGPYTGNSGRATFFARLAWPVFRDS